MQKKLLQSPLKKIQVNRYSQDKNQNSLNVSSFKSIQKNNTIDQNFRQKYSQRIYRSLTKDYKLSKQINTAQLIPSKFSMYETLKTLQKQKRQNQKGKKNDLTLPQIKFKNRLDQHGSGSEYNLNLSKKQENQKQFDYKQPHPASEGTSKIKQKSTQFHISIRSKAGCNGRIMKINQDLEIVQQRLPFDLKLFCVCDGHGNNGHHVVAFIKKKLLQNIRRILKNLQNFDYFQQQIYFAFQKVNQELLQSQINTQSSGAAITAIFIYKGRIICFNVGDSRAILFNFQYEKWKTLQISKDHKPDKRDQAKRIIENGGRIQYLKNQRLKGLGTLRVWMKQIHSPGLPITRCLGNKTGIRAGIIGEPEVTQVTIRQENKYLLIATNGVWKHLQNHEIAKLLGKQLKQMRIQEAADKLLHKACVQWEEKFNYRDDITFILVKLSQDLECGPKLE